MFAMLRRIDKTKSDKTNILSVTKFHCTSTSTLLSETNFFSDIFSYTFKIVKKTNKQTKGKEKKP